MKKLIGFGLICLSILSGGCSQSPVIDQSVHRISKDYEAIGNSAGIRPFVYGRRTLVEFDGSIWGLTARDEHGNALEYKKEGRYYAFNRVLENFSISSGGKQVTYVLIPVEPPPPGPLSDPRIAEATEPNTGTPVIIATLPPPSRPAILDRPAFIVMQDQMKLYRQLLKKASGDESISGDELQTISNKLDGIDRKMMAGTAIVHVNFKHRSTQLDQNDPALTAVLDAAKHADRINIYGRTSAIVAGRNDPLIAMGRAVAVKGFLVDHGIEESRIQITSLAEGDFIVSPQLKEADQYNRRAAIEIIRKFQ